MIIEKDFSEEFEKGKKKIVKYVYLCNIIKNSNHVKIKK